LALPHGKSANLTCAFAAEQQWQRQASILAALFLLWGAGL